MIKSQKFTKYFCLLPLFISLNIFAEYRLYQYWVKSPDRENAELVTSSLDLESYLAYYGSKSTTKINLVRSWRCPGFTGNMQPYCTFREPDSMNNPDTAQAAKETEKPGQTP